MSPILAASLAANPTNYSRLPVGQGGGKCKTIGAASREAFMCKHTQRGQKQAYVGLHHIVIRECDVY